MPVPSEFVGLARVFRQRVFARDVAVQSTLTAITRPLIERYRRKPTIRKEMLQDFLRAWSERITDDYTLDEDVTVTREALVVRELRVIAGRGNAENWQQPEWQPGISLARVAVSARDREVKLTAAPVAHLLLHALGRRFERGDGRDAASVMRDLKSMADRLTAAPTPSEVEEVEEIECVVGRWVGHVKHARDDSHGRDVWLFEGKTFLT